MINLTIKKELSKLVFKITLAFCRFQRGPNRLHDEVESSLFYLKHSVDNHKLLEEAKVKLKFRKHLTFD
jgi:hypothetical protein